MVSELVGLILIAHFSARNESLGQKAVKDLNGEG